jgi:hypothetical protein
MNQYLPARLAVACLALLAFGTTACQGSQGSENEAYVKDSPGTAKDVGKADAWGYLDNPARLNANLEYVLDDLPLDGEAERIPWPGSYWPTHQDSINHRWDGENSMSPAEKYEKAFELSGIEDYVSRSWGVDAHTSRPTCESSSDCSDGQCAKRRGETSGHCIPTWWGVCHAWAPAAIMEPEPLHPVTKNGVTFEIADLKALGTVVYNWITEKHISLRCDTEGGEDMAVDAYGNPTGDDAECKDTNPGTFHVVTTNFLGLMARSFVEDRTYDAEVWNQPVARYEVTLLEGVDIAKAHELLDVPESEGSETYIFNPEAAQLYHAKMDLDYVTESNSSSNANLASTIESYLRTDRYEYILELDEDGKVIGGEWIGASKTNHPDFLWLPTGIQTLVHNTPPIAPHLVRELLAEAANPEISDDSDSSSNGGATGSWELTSPETHSGEVAVGETDRFGPFEIHDGAIKVTLTGDGDADLYVRREGEPTTSTYDCRPYLSNSNESCTLEGVGRYYVAIQGYSASTYELEVAPTDSGATTSSADTPTPTFTEIDVDSDTNHASGAVAADETLSYGPYTVTEGGFEAAITGTGDADLYVREGQAPTTSLYDCRPYQPDSNETCTHDTPGTYYVSVVGYTESTFELAVGFTGEGTEDAPAAELPENSDALVSESGALAEGEMKVFTLTVSEGQSLVARTASTNDIDLYLRMDSAPTIDTWDARGYTATGNEEISYEVPSGGTLHIGVHGYEAGDFQLEVGAE